MIPLTFAITAADWSENQDMLRMMFNCLAKQTVKDFDVIVADHNYVARKDAVAELAEKYALRVKHMPLIPAPHVAKRYLDCSVFNAGWIMSEAERCVRYSEWRLVTPDFVETMLGEPVDQVVDFCFHNIVDVPEAEFWNRETAEIYYDKIPDFYEQEINAEYEPELMPLHCYANNGVGIHKWEEVNGFNEVSFNFYHWEDFDYNARCNNSGFMCRRIPGKMYRINHQYGLEHNRGNRKPELQHKEWCSACQGIHDYVAYHVGPPTYGTWTEGFRLNPHMKRFGQGYFTWLVCQQCNNVVPEIDGNDVDHDYFQGKIAYKRAPINVSGSGRNMRILREDMKGKSWGDKIELFGKSWTDPKYLHEDVYNDFSATWRKTSD